jgi:hypothetical protein
MKMYFVLIQELCQNAIREGIKVILPEYFDDCFRLGQICNDVHYLFPNPAIYKSDLVDLLNVKSISRSASKLSPVDPNPQFLAHQVIFIDPDLFPDPVESKNPEELPRWIKLILVFGGKLTSKLANATIAITDIQSKIYEQVFRVDVGTGFADSRRDPAMDEGSGETREDAGSNCCNSALS